MSFSVSRGEFTSHCAEKRSRKSEPTGPHPPESLECCEPTGPALCSTLQGRAQAQSHEPDSLTLVPAFCSTLRTLLRRPSVFPESLICSFVSQPAQQSICCSTRASLAHARPSVFPSHSLANFEFLSEPYFIAAHSVAPSSQPSGKSGQIIFLLTLNS
jgi:hypothetical protein